MYLMVSTFQFRRPISPELVAQTEREVVDPLTQQPGFRAYYACRSGETEITTVHVWDSETAAQNAVRTVSPHVQRVLGSELVGSVERTGGEVEVHRQR